MAGVQVDIQDVLRALRSGDWYSFRKFDDAGELVKNRMTYENVIVIAEGVTMPDLEEFEEKKAELERDIVKVEIYKQLDLIDSRSIRPLRAIAAGKDVQLDRDKLSELEREREQLLAKLEAE